jgi:hypothetical protein
MSGFLHFAFCIMHFPILEGLSHTDVDGGQSLLPPGDLLTMKLEP